MLERRSPVGERLCLRVIGISHHMAVPSHPSFRRKAPSDRHKCAPFVSGEVRKVKDHTGTFVSREAGMCSGGPVLRSLIHVVRVDHIPPSTQHSMSDTLKQERGRNPVKLQKKKKKNK